MTNDMIWIRKRKYSVAFVQILFGLVSSCTGPLFAHVTSWRVSPTIYRLITQLKKIVG